MSPFSHWQVKGLSSKRITLKVGNDDDDDDDEVMLNVLRCQLTYWGQAVTNAEARFNHSLRPRKPEGSLGRTARDGHLDSHTAPELCESRCYRTGKYTDCRRVRASFSPEILQAWAVKGLIRSINKPAVRGLLRYVYCGVCLLLQQ